MTVRITNIQHFSLHDGPGIRTTVFLKGCNLTCPWCCNPENINYEIESYEENGLKKEFGYDISLEDLEKEILKDDVYYDNGGGVTFSGGEPLLQIKSLEPLLKSLKEKEINICFETALSVPLENLKLAIEYADELFIDVKLLNQDAKNVLNINLSNYFNNLNLIKENDFSNICFRIPLNNEYTLKEENKELLIDFAKEFSDYKFEIFKTHNLAESKYSYLNKEIINLYGVSDEDINNFYLKLKEVNENVNIISI